ncbi:MAG: HDOD domain-containing protein [Gammaproteobacteria bacterium]|nr:HDOD domain-containing protein [Gammaproteobacteria bacterium]
MILIVMSAVVIAVLGLWLLLRRPAKPARKARGRHPGCAEALDPESTAAMRAAYGELLPGPAARRAETPDAPVDEDMDTGTLAFTLLVVEDLEPGEAARLRARLANIDMPPRAVEQLISPEFMDNASPRELTELLTCEPVLAGKIIGRVNSPFYGLSVPIVSVAHAITYLGVNVVRNMALQFSLEQSFESKNPELRRFHSQLLDVGSIAVTLVEALAPKLGVRDVGAASTQTVLSFLGDFVVPQLSPQYAAIRHWPLGLIERTTSEQFSLGVNAMVVGQLLMETWQLPASIAEDVRDMHRIVVTPASDPVADRDARLALCYTCARLAESIELGQLTDAGQIDIADPRVAELFQLQGYLARRPLAQLPGLFASNEFRRVLARLSGGRMSRTQPLAASA